MKNKLFLLIAICSLSFISCDDFNDARDNLVDQLLGSASLTFTDTEGLTSMAPNGPAVVDRAFQSCVTGTIDDSTSNCAIVCADIDLSNLSGGDITIPNPVLLLKLNDTLPQVYNMEEITLSTLESWRDGFDPQGIVFSPTTNMTVMVDSDTSWYVSLKGSVRIDDYATTGFLTKGEFQKVPMLYLTSNSIHVAADSLNHLADLAENGSVLEQYQAAQILLNTKVTDFFPILYLSGTFESRRMMVSEMIHKVMDGIDDDITTKKQTKQ